MIFFVQLFPLFYLLLLQDFIGELLEYFVFEVFKVPDLMQFFPA